MNAVLHLHLVQLLPVSLQGLNGIHDLCTGLVGHPYLWLGNILTGQDGTQDPSQLGWGQALHDSSYRLKCCMASKQKGNRKGDKSGGNGGEDRGGGRNQVGTRDRREREGERERGTTQGEKKCRVAAPPGKEIPAQQLSACPQYSSTTGLRQDLSIRTWYRSPGS